MNNISSFNIITLIVMALTILVVLIGIATLPMLKNLKDKEKNNKLMMMRVSLQATIIMMLAVRYFLTR